MHLVAVDLRDNSAAADGGALFCENASVDLVGCLLAGNSSGGLGGAIYVATADTSALQLASCTFAENESALAGGAVAIGAGGWRSASDSAPVAALGSIFRDNRPDELAGEGIVALYSDVGGGWPGRGNLDVDPRFVSFRGVDFLLGRLRSASTRGPLVGG